MANMDGRFSNVNPAFARLLGYTCEELQRKHFLEITHPEDAAAKQERLKRLLDSGSGQVTFEARYLRKSGDSCGAPPTFRFSMTRRAAPPTS